MSSISATNSLPIADTQDVTRLAGRKIASAKEAKSAGKEFESLFLSLMIKQMRSSLEGGFFQGESSDVYGGMFDMMLGQSMAESAPLGIQSLVTDFLKRQAPEEDSSETTAQPKTPLDIDA